MNAQELIKKSALIEKTTTRTRLARKYEQKLCDQNRRVRENAKRNAG